MTSGRSQIDNETCRKWSTRECPLLERFPRSEVIGQRDKMRPNALLRRRLTFPQSCVDSEAELFFCGCV